MKDKKNDFSIEKPKLPIDLEGIESIGQLEDESYISSGVIGGYIIENQVADAVTFNEVIFKNSAFIGSSLNYAELTDVRFEHCDLSNVDFRNSIIHRVEFINCKVMGINLSESTLRNVRFNQCSGDYGFFSFADCKAVKFQDCELCYSDFQDCNFNKVGFYNTDLTQCQMSGTKLKDIDFTSCNVDGIGARIDNLRGAIFSPVQAVSLSKLMGIIIR